MTGPGKVIVSLLFFFCGALLHVGVCAEGAESCGQQLAVTFDGKRGQVEVGGPFAGVEFHESRPLPSRISFYYPVANSIDLSTDYWQRGNSRPMVVETRTGDGEWTAVGNEPWVYTLSPHRVFFSRTDDGLAYTMSYEFCLRAPALVQRLTITNTRNIPMTVRCYTRLLAALRTSHTYARKDSGWTEYDRHRSMIVVHNNDPETDRASLFVLNTGEPPSDWTTDAASSGIGESSGSSRKDSLGKTLIPQSRGGIPAAVFLYRKNLAAGDSLRIVQVIGSCQRSEVARISSSLVESWSAQVWDYDAMVKKSAYVDATFESGDPAIDRTATWARALLATNAHYLHGSILPMPCPAEYNFFFTHDALVTDLGAVQFDPPRVCRDLLYIASHARDGIIPHAQYWKDDHYATEYCAPDNWNHHWFVLVTASYLRHSLDDSTGRVLYPVVTKSLDEVLRGKHDDGLMHGSRPDWWDIGQIDGARSYLTILTVRALREYLFISSFLGNHPARLPELELLADSMEQALGARLWDSQAGFLMNFNMGIPDRHYYMGSLLASPFGLLGDTRRDTLVMTASRELFDPHIGLRNAMPTDFHTSAMKEFYRFAGDEAGRPFYYMNGGVWSHGNAWYVLALLAAGRRDDAVNVLRSTMTLDGIVNSPNGQPALYEYRYADPSSPDYGMVDKPSFLWAGGFYLYAIYQLFGIHESPWNISCAAIVDVQNPVAFTFALGRTKHLGFDGRGGLVSAISIDGSVIPSVIIPLSAADASRVTMKRSSGRTMSLQRINAIVHDVTWEPRGKALAAVVSSFPGHHTTAEVLTPVPVVRVTVDGTPIDTYQTVRAGGEFLVTVRFSGSTGRQRLRVQF
jgi:hypothetical protein